MNDVPPPPTPAPPGWIGFPPLPRLPDLRPEIQPYPFQDWTLAKSARQTHFAIGAATGLGKTFMSYDDWKRLRALHPGTRAIILTNKSASLQFAGEHAKFYSSDMRIMAIYDKMAKLGQRKYGDTRRRAYEMFGSPEGDHLDAFVINYHLLRMDIGMIETAAERLVAQGIKLVLITDEATAYKNRDTLTYKAVNTLACLASKSLVLTATLTKGKLEHFWGIFAGINLSHVIAPNYPAFLEEFCITVQSRDAVLPKAKLEEVYYFIVRNGLDDGTILGVRAFFRRFAVKVSKGNACLGLRDLDGIHALCARSPQFLSQVPTKKAFYDRLGVKFESPDRTKDPQIVGYKNLPEFIARVSPYLVILTKADAADFLPPFVSRIVQLDHTPEQRRLIHDIYSGEVRPGDFGLWGGDLSGDAEGMAEVAQGAMPVERLTEQGHIRRALLDPRLVHKQRLDDLSAKEHAPKTEELLRFLRDEATGERVIVYTPSKAHLKLLAATIREADGLDEWYADPLEIHGDIDAGSREQARLLFQESPGRRLIMLNDAGLESLNLQAASILVVMGMPRSGGDMIQLAGRLSRLGSKHQSLLVVYLLTEESQDEDDYDVVQRQMQVVSLVMGEAEKGLLDHERLRILDGVSGDVSAEAYKRSSLDRLVLARRSRRMRSYGVALPG